jgi:L-alanine-DL-glutamate epimerase-like enolase superfamily enzyme
MTLASVQADHFRIALPTVLSDSTHGEISHFELVTVRLRDADGAEGLGYTYTVDAGGGAIHSLIARDLAPLLSGQDSSRIEQLWQKMWWHLHFVGRGGVAAFAVAAVDIALWDLRARRAGLPLWRLLGGHDPKVPAYAGGIDLRGAGAGRRDARAARTGHPADGRCQHALAGRRGDPRVARSGRARRLLAGGAHDPGRCGGPCPDRA